MSWTEANRAALGGLFGASGGRYRKAAEKTVKLRAPIQLDVPYAAYIHPNNPDSGAYSRLSFVIFPVADAPCLAGLVVGTQGLMPDEAILGRPGHARKAQAICAWLNREFGDGSRLVAWAKHDPTRTDIMVPESVRQGWPEHKAILDR